jgi:hypothetical protein
MNARIHIALRNGTTRTLPLPIAPAIGQRIHFEAHKLECVVVDVVYKSGRYEAVAEEI